MAESDEVLFYQGQDAFERGEDLIACPYAALSTDHRVWLAGWDEAKRYAESKTGIQPRVEPPP